MTQEAPPQLTPEEAQRRLQELESLMRPYIEWRAQQKAPPASPRERALRRLPGPLRGATRVLTASPLDIPGVEQAVSRLPRGLEGAARIGLASLAPTTVGLAIPFGPAGAAAGALLSVAAHQPEEVAETWRILTLNPMSHPKVREQVERMPEPARTVTASALQMFDPLNAIVTVATLGAGAYFGGLRAVGPLLLQELRLTAQVAGGMAAGTLAGRAVGGETGGAVGGLLGGLAGGVGIEALRGLRAQRFREATGLPMPLETGPPAAEPPRRMLPPIWRDAQSYLRGALRDPDVLEFIRAADQRGWPPEDRVEAFWRIFLAAERRAREAGPPPPPPRRAPPLSETARSVLTSMGRYVEEVARERGLRWQQAVEAADLPEDVRRQLLTGLLADVRTQVLRDYLSARAVAPPETPAALPGRREAAALAGPAETPAALPGRVEPRAEPPMAPMTGIPPMLTPPTPETMEVVREAQRAVIAQPWFGRLATSLDEAVRQGRLTREQQAEILSRIIDSETQQALRRAYPRQQWLPRRRIERVPAEPERPPEEPPPPSPPEGARPPEEPPPPAPPAAPEAEAAAPRESPTSVTEAMAREPIGGQATPPPVQTQGQIILLPQSRLQVPVEWRWVPVDELLHSRREGYPDVFQPRQFKEETVAAILGRPEMWDEILLRGSPMVNADGPPIVDRRGIVLGGNHRTVALERIVSSPEARQRYYEAARRVVGEVPEDAEARRLVLVRVAQTDDPELLRDIARESNVPMARPLSPSEQAVDDARYLPDSLVRELEFTREGDPVLTGESRDAVLTWLRGMGHEAGAYVVEGRITRPGLQRLKRAMMARAYSLATPEGELHPRGRQLLEETLEEIDTERNKVAKALLDSAGEAARARASGLPRELDISEDVLRAWDIYQRHRDTGVSIEELVSQTSFLEARPSPVATRLATLFAETRSRQQLRDIMRRYWQLAWREAQKEQLRETPQLPGMPEVPPPQSAEQLLHQAVSEVAAERPQMAGLFDLAEARQRYQEMGTTVRRLAESDELHQFVSGLSDDELLNATQRAQSLLRQAGELHEAARSLRRGGSVERQHVEALRELAQVLRHAVSGQAGEEARQMADHLDELAQALRRGDPVPAETVGEAMQGSLHLLSDMEMHAIARGLLDASERLADEGLPPIGGGRQLGEVLADSLDERFAYVREQILDLLAGRAEAFQNLAGQLVSRRLWKPVQSVLKFTANIPILQTVIDHMPGTVRIYVPNPRFVAALETQLARAGLPTETAEEMARMANAASYAYQKMMMQAGESLRATGASFINGALRQAGLEYRDYHFILPSGRRVPYDELLANPGRYVKEMTEEQAKVVRWLRQLLDDVEALDVRDEILPSLWTPKEGERYVPRIPLSPGRFRRAEFEEYIRMRAAEGAEGTMVGALKTFQRERFFQTVLEGIEAGVDYLNDPGAIIISRIVASLEARTEAAAKSVLRTVGISTGRLPASPVIRHWLERYFLPDEGSTLLRIMNAVNGFWVGLRATGDLSFTILQGAVGATVDPGAWAQAVAAGARAFLFGDAGEALLQDSRFLPKAMRFIRAGGTWRSSFEPFEYLRDVARGSRYLSRWLRWVSDLPDPIRLAAMGPAKALAFLLGRFDMAFATAQNVMAVEQFDNLWRVARGLPPERWTAWYARFIARRILQAAPENEEEKMRIIAHLAERLAGRHPLTGVSRAGRQTLRTLFFAPGYQWAAVSLLLEGLNAGTTSGRLALSALMSMAAAGILLYTGVAFLAGQEPQLDPRYPTFMTLRIGKRRVGIGGPFYALARLFSTAFTDPKSLASTHWVGREANPVLRYFYSRASPLVSLVIDYARGRTYAGERVEATPTGLARSLTRQALPISAESAIREHDPAGTLASFFGARDLPMSPWEELHDARALTLRLLKERQPEVFGRYDSIEQVRREDQAALWAIDQEPTVQPYLEKARRYQQDRAFDDPQTQYARRRDELLKERQERMQRLDQALLRGEISPSQWRQRRGEVAREFSLRLQEAREQMLPKREREAPKGSVNAALDAYYSVNLDDYTDPVTGEVDWSGFRKAQEAALGGLSPAQRGLVERYLERFKTPLERQYDADLRTLQPYFDAEENAWAGFRRRLPPQWQQLTWAQVQALASLRRVVARPTAAMLRADVYVRLVRRLADRIKRRLRLQNEAIDLALVRWGYVSRPLLMGRRPSTVSALYGPYNQEQEVMPGGA